MSHNVSNRKLLSKPMKMFILSYKTLCRLHNYQIKRPEDLFTVKGLDQNLSRSVQISSTCKYFS